MIGEMHWLKLSRGRYVNLAPSYMVNVGPDIYEPGVTTARLWTVSTDNPDVLTGDDVEVIRSRLEALAEIADDAVARALVATTDGRAR